MEQEGFVPAAKAIRRPAPSVSGSRDVQKRDGTDLDALSASPPVRSLPSGGNPNGGKKSRFASQMAEQRERAAAATRHLETTVDRHPKHDPADDEHGVPVVLSRIYEREVTAAPSAPELRTTAFPAAAHRSEAGAPSLGRKVNAGQTPSWAALCPSAVVPESEDDAIDRENRKRCMLCVQHRLCQPNRTLESRAHSRTTRTCARAHDHSSPPRALTHSLHPRRARTHAIPAPAPHGERLDTWPRRTCQASCDVRRRDT
jgi:hypothetical protein